MIRTICRALFGFSAAVFLSSTIISSVRHNFDMAGVAALSFIGCCILLTIAVKE